MITRTSSLLRGITDELATVVQQPAADQSVHQLVARVKEISAKASDEMRAGLRCAFPDIGWNASESTRGEADRGGVYWVYDPIDGAYHYIQGLPLWSSSLALVKDGRTVLALVYEPMSRELFVAKEGEGTTVNGTPVRLAGKSDLRAAVVGTSLPPSGYGDPREFDLAATLLLEVSRRVFVTRQMASASLQLAYVASGRLDAYVETGFDVYDWMGGALLVEEAGGKVCALDGTPFGVDSYGVIAASAGLSDELIRCAKEVVGGSAA